ncbi:MAG: aspartate aminotransferase family protein, partial [Chloroflexi bacterium]|nr:aspartate aminotransferase family protein [Chloroflexota bacterium]
MKLPARGKTRDELDQQLQLEASKDVDWKGGKIWTLVYYAGDDVAAVLGDTFTQYLYTNGLGPTAFKSLKRFES